MVKIMISQPMRGKSEEEIRKDRQLALDCIEEAGFEHVESIMAKIPSETKNEGLWCLGASFERMSFADGVLFLGNWTKYRGCRLEYLACRAYGIKTYQLTEDDAYSNGWTLVDFMIDGNDFSELIALDASKWEER